MSKSTKTLISNYKKTEESIKESEREQERITNEILKNEIICNKLKEIYDGKPGYWKAKSVSIRNDSDIDNNYPKEFEWIRITESKYDKLLLENKDDVWDNVKEEYIYETKNTPFEIKYYQRVEKKYEYLRVYVEEKWGYGGHDITQVDFLITDILDIKDIRKEKLKIIMS
jgi:hypothetical protein